jgi:hypothetical protein
MPDKLHQPFFRSAWRAMTLLEFIMPTTKVKRPHTLVISFIVLHLLSCGQLTRESNRKPGPLSYDTSVIAIFKWDPGKYYSFPKNSDSTVLSQQELNDVDSLFKSAVKTYNDEQRQRLPRLYKSFQIQDSSQFLLDISKYKRQYFPFENVNGERIVYINCFCIDKFHSPYPDWKTVEVFVDDGGSCYFNLKVNLATKKWSDFWVNGYG